MNVKSKLHSLGLVRVKWKYSNNYQISRFKNESLQITNISEHLLFYRSTEKLHDIRNKCHADILEK